MGRAIFPKGAVENPGVIAKPAGEIPEQGRVAIAVSIAGVQNPKGILLHKIRSAEGIGGTAEVGERIPRVYIQSAELLFLGHIGGGFA